MKTIKIFLLILMFFALLAGVVNGQSPKVKKDSVKWEYKLNADGEVVKTAKPIKNFPKKDTVYMKVDGIQFYIGPKGGVYYWKKNSKGVLVKKYIKSIKY